ncbi:trypsin-like serine protease [Sinorhizobium meliloti]|uniref:trypsin-like serine protease n=1 Tax=Rhizobium meliloti TaxID=382 RepID=UPI000FE0941A|nr:trypsin-like serine protease [Sinorhizobium meliloti]RVL95742.1 protease [Sinorhizobium meliloti]
MITCLFRQHNPKFKGILVGFSLSLFISIGFGHSAIAADAKLLTFDEIKRISPKANDEFVQAFLDAEGDFAAAGITTRLRMAHFLAQVMTETGGMRRIDENMNYSFATLMRVFSRKTISEAKAREIAGKPREIANWVYGNRLGNRGRKTLDGWNYRGSGFIQLTGLTNFRVRGDELGLPLEKNPELARQTREGLQAAIAYWRSRNINAAADDNDVFRVRKLVNGPKAHGLDQTRIWFKQAWTRVFRAKASVGFEGAEVLAESGVLDESALFDDILQESGLLDPDALEAGGDEAAARAEALRQFQRELSLPETGELDENTKLELLDPREWRHLDGSDALPARVEGDLDQTVVLQLDGASTEAADAAPVEPEKGTGASFENSDITAEDLQALEKAKGSYSEYEMSFSGPGVTSDDFEPFSVIVPDTRSAVVETKSFPARAIVQILFRDNTGTQRLCSGSMVSSNTVLTAGHCVHSGTTTGQPYSNFRVIPGRNKSAAPFGRCKGRQAFVLSGWVTSLTPDESRYYDLGAIKLDCEVGNATGWLGVRTLGNGENGVGSIVQGYAADLDPSGQQWVSEDKIRFLSELKGFYQNDTFGGTSGSPVFATETNDTLIGVHTNGLHGNEDPWKSNNAFTRITPERLARIQEWISR